MSPTIAGFARYRTRPVGIEAIQYLGITNCEEVYAFLGLEHPATEDDHAALNNIGVNKPTPDVGDWIIRIVGDLDAGSVVDVCTDEDFHDEFEAVVDD